MAPTVFDKLNTNLTALLNRQPRPDLAPHPDSLAARQEASDFALSWTHTFRRKESDILADGHLSDLGRQDKLRRVAAEAAGDLGPLRRPIVAAKELQGRHKNVVLDYQQLPEGQDRLEALLLAQEVRAEFRTLRQDQRDAGFIAAAQRGDRVTMRAMMSAPAGAWISGETLQRAEQLYASKRDPEVWEQLQRLQGLLDHLTSLARMIALALLAYHLEPAQIETALGLTFEEMQLDRPTPKGAGRG